MTKADVARALSEAALEIEGMTDMPKSMPKSEHFAHKNVIQLADEITRLLEENKKLKEMLGEAKDILEREANYKFGQYCDSERIKEFLNKLNEMDKDEREGEK